MLKGDRVRSFSLSVGGTSGRACQRGRGRTQEHFFIDSEGRALFELRKRRQKHIREKSIADTHMGHVEK